MLTLPFNLFKFTPSLTYCSALSHLFQSSSLVLAPRMTVSPVFSGPFSPIKSYAAVIGEAWSLEASILTLAKSLVSTSHILSESADVISLPSGRYLPCLVGLDMARNCKKQGIRTQACFVIGHPNERLKDFLMGMCLLYRN